VRILLIEPYFTGSHRQWANALSTYSRHEIKLLTLAGRHWKWRMHGGAVTLAKQFLEMDWVPELILASDMLDVSTFLALIRTKVPQTKLVLYFHENQLNYPWSPNDQDTQLQRDNHYAFINFTAALSADAVFFNSKYHQNAFLEALPVFLKQFPDHHELWSIDVITQKSSYLPLGLDLQKLDQYRVVQTNKIPLLLWNHRWEYDKNPQAFFEVLFELSEEGFKFQLAVVGEKYRRYPAIFKEAKQRLASHIVQWGYVEDFATYAHWLWKADILPVTSIHDFFGASVVEAIYCNCHPLLPNRLAYPEHLPNRDEHFYDTTAALKQKLKYLLQQPKLAIKSCRTAVKRYDWQQLIAQYDQALSNIYH